MEYRRSIKYWTLLISLMFSYLVYSQQKTEDQFYKHLTGTLDTSMNITFDLLAKNGLVNGFYYYYFPDPGNKELFHFGKTIPLEGTLEGSSIILNEFANTDSKFEGVVDQSGVISGTWKQNAKKKPISFNISEDYSNGTIPLKCYSLEDSHILKTNDHRIKVPPEANIDITLLYPHLSQGNPLKDTFDVILTKFLLNEVVDLTSPEVLLEDMSFDFFTSYKNATAGIEDLSTVSSFNWEKKVNMEVTYNENNLLSLRIEKYAYTGGAHGIEFTEFFVINTQKNSKVLLSEIFRPGFESELDTILNSKLRRLNGIKDEENLKEAGFFMESITHVNNFYINNDGIGFYYNLYSIAPYSAGTTELFLSYREIKGLLSEEHPFIWGMRE